MVDTMMLAVRPKRAATMLGISHKTIYDLINSGKLKAVKIGKRAYLIPMKEIHRFLGQTG